MTSYWMAVAALLLLPAGVSARTWHILNDGSGDAPTIQAGIDSAGTGDSVLVHAGTYPGILHFAGQSITVISAFGPLETIIDATEVGYSVARFDSGQGGDSRLEGFTLKGGTQGVEIINAEPSIVGNIITGNGPFGGPGAGVRCLGSGRQWAPLISNNEIRGNVTGSDGGGIAVYQDATPEITYNLIADNESHGNGGGIIVRTLRGGTIIQHNRIDRNVASDRGGGLYVMGVGDPLPIDLDFNVISRNQADGVQASGSSGGGLWLSNTNAMLHHLTVVQNAGNGGSIYGGGIVFEGSGVPQLETSIVAFNTVGGGIACLGGATPLISNNLAWENVGGDGVGSCATWWQSDGNIVANPSFCDMVAGEFTLAQNSPAMTHPAGPLGAFPDPGCGPLAVTRLTWGALKSRYP